MELGSFVTAVSPGVEAQLALSARIPLSDRVALRPVISMNRSSKGNIAARDGLLLVPIRLVDTATTRLSVSPGLNLPIGSVGAGTQFTPLSTGSVDPWLGVDAISGSAWLVSASVAVRTPLYAGTDGVRQGPYVRTALRGARRIGQGGAAWLGVSPVVGTPSSDGRGSFAEVAAVAGGTIPLGATWALTPQTRVPLWQVTSSYAVSFGLSVSAVIGGNAGDDH
ncbi:MAG: hypothetical protein ACI8PZ_003205 [Myxococcota bacterium]